MQQVHTDYPDRGLWTVASPRRRVFDLAERQHAFNNLTHVSIDQL